MLGISSCTPPERTLARVRSAFQTVVVTEQGTRRCMRFGEGPRALNQTCVRTEAPQRVELDYARAVVALAATWPHPAKRALIIGLGGGAIPMALHDLSPSLELEVSELDPAVISMARTWFGYTLPATAEDGALTLARGGPWDLIIFDAFDDQGIAPGLFTEQTLRHAKQALAPGGVLLANTFQQAPTAATELSLLRATFDAVQVFEVKHNRVLVAGAALPDHAAWLERMVAAPFEAFGADDAWVRQALR